MSNSRHGTIGACCQMLGAGLLLVVDFGKGFMVDGVGLGLAGDRFLKIVHFVPFCKRCDHHLKKSGRPAMKPSCNGTY